MQEGFFSYRQYKIKRETCGNKTGEAFALTIPRPIAQAFSDCKFTINITKDSIIFKSGMDLKQLEKEVKNVQFNDLIKNG